MKTRPKELTLLAILLIGVAAAFPMQIMVVYDHTPEEILAIAAKLAPLNWALMALCPLTAWLALRSSPLLIGVAPILAAMVAYNNLLVAQAGQQGGENFSLTTTMVSTALFFAAMSSLLTGNVRKLLANPRLRWWLTPDRIRAVLPVRIKIHNRNLAIRSGFGETEFYTRTFDLSEGGAFIPFERAAGSVSAPPPAVRNVQGHHVLGLPSDMIPVGTQCYVSIPLRGLEYMQCRAEVVRSMQPCGNYPGGIGIRFLNLTFAEQRKLKSLLGEIPTVQGQIAGATLEDDDSKAA